MHRIWKTSSFTKALGLVLVLSLHLSFQNVMQGEMTCDSIQAELEVQSTGEHFHGLAQQMAGHAFWKNLTREDQSCIDAAFQFFEKAIEYGAYPSALVACNRLFTILDQTADIDSLRMLEQIIAPHLGHIQDYREKVTFHLNQSNVEAYRNNLFAAYEASEKARSILVDAGNTSTPQFAEVLTLCAEWAFNCNLYPRAINLYEDARKLAVQLKENDLLIDIKTGEASIYSRLGLFEEAKSLREEIYAASNLEEDRSLIASLKYYEARDFRDQDMVEEELRNLRKALALTKNQGELQQLYYLSICDLSSTHARSNSLDSARHYFDLVKEIYQPAGTMGWRDVFYFKTEAYYAYAIDDLFRCEIACKRGIEICVETENIEAERRFGELLEEALHRQGKSAEAYTYLKRSSSLRDQIVNATNVNRMQLLQETFEVEQKEDQIKLLESSAKRRKSVFIGIGFASLLLIGFAWALWSRRRSLNEKNRLVSEVENATNQLREDKDVIEQQAQELKQLDTMKNQFFSNISHELRTPLTLIQSPVAKLAESQNMTKKQSFYLSLIQDNSEILSDRVGELLELSRIDTGKAKLRRNRVDLGAIIDKCIRIFIDFAAENKVQLINHNKVGSALVVCDERRLSKIIQNLIHNAIKFTPENGTVELGAQYMAGQLKLIIEDTGIGMPAKDIDQIFERFYQLPTAATMANPGTGLGLSMVSEYVELMSGQVEVKSEEGKGTQFTITLDLPEALPDDLADQGAMGEKTDFLTPVALDQINTVSNLPTVLIAEDNKQLRFYLESLLEGLYHVVQAQNGQEALDVLKRDGSVDIILSDVMMPRMDGLELLQRVRNNPNWRRLPFLFLTAKTNQQFKLESFHVGVDDFLTKPFSEKELLARLAALYKNYLVRINSESEDVDGGDDTVPDDNSWTSNVESFIKTNLDHPSFGVDLVAEHCGMSRRHLTRVMKKEVGLTPNEYIKEIRLCTARELLAANVKPSIKVLAAAVGFSDAAYFSRQFKDRFGVSEI